MADFLGVFAVVRRGDRYLFVANERRIAGELRRTWDLPGGGVEAGESLHEALRRELDEETSTRPVGEPEFLYVQEGERVQADERLYAWRSFFFRTELDGEPRAGGEVLDVRWMTAHEAMAACDAPYHDSFRIWLQRGGHYFRSAWRD